MIRYDIEACIGSPCEEAKPVQIKKHDTGVRLAVHLVHRQQVSKWRAEKQAYQIPELSAAIVRVRKPDGTKYESDKTVIEGRSTVVHCLEVQGCTAAGICEAEIVLYDTEQKRLTSATFRYEITAECVCDDDPPSADYFDVLGKQIAEVSEAATAANKAIAATIEAAKSAQTDARTAGTAAGAASESAQAAEKAAKRAEEAAEKAEQAGGGTEVPTKISDLEDDTTEDAPIGHAESANYAKHAAVAGYLQNDEDYAKKEDLSSIEAIAKGRSTGYVFDTVEEMNFNLGDTVWTDTLVLGDNIYIRDTGVPDYWWDGNKVQPLETQKVDLTEYVTRAEFNSAIGDIETTLDSIIALQESYIGGDSA